MLGWRLGQKLGKNFKFDEQLLKKKKIKFKSDGLYGEHSTHNIIIRCIYRSITY